MGALDEDTGKVRSRVEGVARCKSESGAMSIAAKALCWLLMVTGMDPHTSEKYLCTYLPFI